MNKTVIDDGFQSYLTENANFVGKCGIPELLDLNNTQIPIRLISFSKISREKNYCGYIHFYIHDYKFASVLAYTKRYINVFKKFDGVITPDCSLLIGQSLCLQQTNTYFNRAVGLYLQRQGIPVIPNIRWSNEESFDFCFLGVPKNSIVSISTHGCIQSKKEKGIFKLGLDAMIETLRPKAVLVHGYMPKEIFEDYLHKTTFYRYKSEIESIHDKEPYGHRL